MPTRNINLTERYDSFLARQIDSGRFKNASEVVRAALHLLEREERLEEAKLDGLRREARSGKEAYGRGDYTALPDEAALDRFFDDIADDVDNS